MRTHHYGWPGYVFVSVWALCYTCGRCIEEEEMNQGYRGVSTIVLPDGPIQVKQCSLN
jgi:hypothetical protein